MTAAHWWCAGEKAQLSGSAQGVQDYDQQESGGKGAESTTPAGEAQQLGSALGAAPVHTLLQHRLLLWLRQLP